ncbi:MAG: hypothetical protein ACI4TU_01065, partial [Candidatus Cryptobacteroides sp.]
SNIDNLTCAFQNCSKLKYVEFRGPMARVNKSTYAFSGVGSSGVIKINSRYDAYYSAIRNALPSGWTIESDYM